MQDWDCLCLCLHMQPIWLYKAASYWHVVDDRSGMLRMVISQVDLGTPWGIGSVWLSQDITRRHIQLRRHHQPMKMITFDTQMTFYPCCDNMGSFFCSDIRCCVGVIQVKSIILMEKSSDLRIIWGINISSSVHSVSTECHCAQTNSLMRKAVRYHKVHIDPGGPMPKNKQINK